MRIWEADQDIATANDTYIPIGSRKLETTIGGLQPGKMYVLRVLAYSNGGDGKMSSPAKEFILGSYFYKYLDCSSLFYVKHTTLIVYFCAGDPEALRSSATPRIHSILQCVLSVVGLFFFNIISDFNRNHVQL